MQAQEQLTAGHMGLQTTYNAETPMPPHYTVMM